MKVSHTPAAVSAVFDDSNPIAHAGLFPVLRLAERCGLSRLVAEKVKSTGAKNGPWQHAWTQLFDTVHTPPEPA
ncbi:hypothetical protein ACFRFU_42365 [Streptomyces sp. NPDC056704]|uniref:hypothetical protein n=1 Tax=Streptomyces TaxID=1883 RepID=UPI0036A470B1